MAAQAAMMDVRGIIFAARAELMYKGAVKGEAKKGVHRDSVRCAWLGCRGNVRLHLLWTTPYCVECRPRMTEKEILRIRAAKGKVQAWQERKWKAIHFWTRVGRRKRGADYFCKVDLEG